MNTILLTRITVPVLALVLGPPLAAQAGHFDRVFDSIERQADAGADQARHVMSDVIHDVHNPRLRAEMLGEARSVMTGFMQIKMLARQERVHRMGAEVHSVLDSLTRLDSLVHVAERDEARAHHGHGPDVHHIHEVILDLTAQSRALDDLIHQIEGVPPVRYETNYRQPRAVYPRSRPVYDVPPSGISVGGRGFRIEFGR